MKVLIVSNTYPPADISGVGSLAQELLEGLGDFAELEVLTRTAPANDPRVIATGGPKILFPLLASWYARLGKHNYDVVHVNESDGIVLALLIAVRRMLRLRTPELAATFQVSYKREAFEVRPVSADGHPISVPSRSEKLFKWVRAPLLEVAGKLTARLADRIVACSRFTVNELADDYGVDPQRVIAIANGIRLGASPIRQQQPDDSRPLRALFVGRLRTRKAVAVALAALTHSTVENVELSIVGDGEQDEALRRQAADSGLVSAGRVHFLGRRTREQVAQHYQEADVFILPSTYEGFPVAILEAMAAGLPIVATRVAGIPEAIVDGESGILVDPEDARGLAAALARLANDRTACRAMGTAARQRIEEHFSIARIGDQYLQLWSAMARAKRGGKAELDRQGKRD